MRRPLDSPVGLSVPVSFPVAVDNPTRRFSILAGIELGTAPPKLLGTAFFASLISVVGNTDGAPAGCETGNPAGKFVGILVGAPAGRELGKSLGRSVGRLPAAERLAKKPATEAGMLEGIARSSRTARAVGADVAAWVAAPLALVAESPLKRLTIEAGTLEGMGPLGRPPLGKVVGAPEGRGPVGKKVAIEVGSPDGRLWGTAPIVCRTASARTREEIVRAPIFGS